MNNVTLVKWLVNACLILIILYLVTACAERPLKVVSGCPQVTIPQKPHYPAQNLRKGDPADKVNKALWSTIMLQDEYNYQLLTILEVINE